MQNSLDEFLQKCRGEGYEPTRQYDSLRELTSREAKIDIGREVVEIDLYWFENRIQRPSYTKEEASLEWTDKFGLKYRNYLNWERFYKSH